MLLDYTLLTVVQLRPSYNFSTRRSMAGAANHADFGSGGKTAKNLHTI